MADSAPSNSRPDRGPPSQGPSDPQPSEGAGLAVVKAVDPQKLLRVAGVTREVLEEARRIRPEPSAVDHLKRVHAQITSVLRDALPPELYEELEDLTPEVRDGTLEELALAHAEILGWLEGLFQGTQLAIQLQMARSAEERFRRPLPPSTLPDRDREQDSRYL